MPPFPIPPHFVELKNFGVPTGDVFTRCGCAMAEMTAEMGVMSLKRSAVIKQYFSVDKVMLMVKKNQIGKLFRRCKKGFHNQLTLCSRLT